MSDFKAQWSNIKDYNHRMKVMTAFIQRYGIDRLTYGMKLL